MKLLLDTHLLIWATVATRQLSVRARELIADPGNDLFFSAVGICEIAIKQGLKRPDFIPDARRLRRTLLDNDYSELALTSDHALAIERLPPIHKDPFDRILIAQATHEGITLLTSDILLPGPILLV